MGVDVQDLTTGGHVWEGEAEFAVEAAWTAEGGVDGVGTVGGADDDDCFFWVCVCVRVR